jgi:hypothetical protein
MERNWKRSGWVAVATHKQPFARVVHPWKASLNGMGHCNGDYVAIAWVFCTSVDIRCQTIMSQQSVRVLVAENADHMLPLQI